MKRRLVLLSILCLCFLLSACSVLAFLCPHKKVILMPVAATCTADGMTEGAECALCGEILIPQEVIPAFGHQLSEPSVVREPTATDGGLAMRDCYLCGGSFAEELAPLGYDAQAEGSEAPQNAALTDTPIAYGVVNGTDVNIRSGPGTDYESLGAFKQYGRLTIYGYEGDWARVEEGWIFRKYVYVDGTVGPNGSHWGTVTGTGVNVRSGPGTAYHVNSQVTKGDRVEILFQARVRNRIWGCTKNGWICMDYVHLDGTPQTGGIVLTEDDFWELIRAADVDSLLIYYFDESRYNYDKSLTFYPAQESDPNWVVQYPSVNGIQSADDIRRELRAHYTEAAIERRFMGVVSYDDFFCADMHGGGWYQIDGTIYFAVNYGWGEPGILMDTVRIQKDTATSWTVYFDYEFDTGSGSVTIVWEDGCFKFG